ncbi:MAG TPA: flagellar hook-basal body complex protein FliE [Pirellulales bacterium]|nr:flagellar hook-basal body complex protein FliE [Pirellulales bacterium]
MSTISSIQVPSLAQAPSAAGAAGAANSMAGSTGGSFKNFLLDSIQQVNSMQQDANQAVEQLATGGDVSPAEVFTAVQKADLAFRMMMQVRNKLVQAYQDVQNIKV